MAGAKGLKATQHYPAAFGVQRGELHAKFMASNPAPPNIRNKPSLAMTFDWGAEAELGEIVKQLVVTDLSSGSRPLPTTWRSGSSEAESPCRQLDALTLPSFQHDEMSAEATPYLVEACCEPDSLLSRRSLKVMTLPPQRARVWPSRRSMDLAMLCGFLALVRGVLNWFMSIGIEVVNR